MYLSLIISAYWPALYNLPVGAPVVVAVLAGCGHCAPVIFDNLVLN